MQLELCARIRVSKAKLLKFNPDLDRRKKKKKLHFAECVEKEGRKSKLFKRDFDTIRDRSGDVLRE